MKRKKKQSGGFTMVEMLFAVAILIILLGLGFSEVLRAFRLMRITELDNAAREIYMAANSRAVSLSCSGRLEALVDDVHGANLTVPSITPGDPRSLRYIRYTPASGVLDDLLPEGTIEPKLKDGSFYIVYETFAGCATDVFYAENTAKLDEFGVFQAGYEPWVSVPPTRDSRIADDKYIGYYGGGFLAVAGRPGPVNALPDPVIEIINDEELQLNVTYDDPAAGSDPDLQLEVKLTYGGNTISLHGPGVISYLAGNKTRQTWILDTLKPNPALHRGQFKDWGWPAGINFGENFTVNARLMKSGWTDGVAAPKSANSLFGEGSVGPSANIKNLRHLQNLSAGFSGVANKSNAIQRNDIDAQNAKKNDGSIIGLYDFVPIENSHLIDYDGVLYNIKNLKVTDSSALWNWGAGLFGALSNATLKNIRLVDVDVQVTTVERITDHTYKIPVGGLIGSSGNNTFIRCSIEGTRGRAVNKILGNQQTGGLAGTTWGTNTFQSCSVQGFTVTSQTNYVGGLVGHMWGSSRFIACKADDIGVDSLAYYAGGLVGLASSGTAGQIAEFTDCVIGENSSITVQAHVGAGGIVGSAQNVKFSVCRVIQAEVIGKQTNGNSIAGGMTGEAKDAKFENCKIGFDMAAGAAETTGSVIVSGGKMCGGLTASISKASNDGGNELNLQDNSITNCDIKNVTITGGLSWDDSTSCIAGGLAGSAEDVTFSICKAEEFQVTNEGSTGGIAGSVMNGIFESCNVAGANTKIIGKASRNWNARPTDNALKAVVLGGLAGTAYVNKVGGQRGDTSFINCVVQNVTIKGEQNGNWMYPVVDERSVAGGLIGTATRAELRGCRAENVNVTGGNNVGGLVGSAAGIIFKNNGSTKTEAIRCTLTGGDQVGGLIGFVMKEGKKDVFHRKNTSTKIGEMDEAPTDISNCNVTDLKITKSTDSAGGLAGGVSESTFTGCTASGTNIDAMTIIAEKNAGGLFGYVGDSTLTGCWANNMTVGSYDDAQRGSAAGGLTGSAEKSTFIECAVGQKGVTDSGTTGTILVLAKKNAGGLVGFAQTKEMKPEDGFVAGQTIETKFLNCKSVNARVEGIASGSINYGGNAGGLAGSAVDTEFDGVQVYWTNKASLGSGSSLNYQIKGETVGGLAGVLAGGCEVRNSFAATLVYGSGSTGGTVGGLVGEVQVKVKEKVISEGNIEKIPDTFMRSTMIKNSYADCYLYGKKSGGLIGANTEMAKPSGGKQQIDLKLQDVYAAGFIRGTGSGAEGAGLYGGEVTAGVGYAYVAMFYQDVGTWHPLAVKNIGLSNCYYRAYGSSPVWKNNNGSTVITPSLGSAFIANTTETYRYGLRTDAGTTGYPFRRLKNTTSGTLMPHYGDWRP